ncbi:MAG: hypothetical protein DWQ06_04085 [Calditrichaeota bacterium]|nr:MAG: hypothetical protein DWQ06_04085 [Calditrichota bacterium]
MDLLSELNFFDGKRVKSLEQVFEKYKFNEFFLLQLVKFVRIEDSKTQTASTWLIKKSLEESLTLEPSLLGKLFTSLKFVEGNWEAELHLCQILHFVEFQKDYKNEIESFVRKCLKSENKFVRAWSYSAFYKLSLDFEEFESEVKMLLESALENEAASVKARIRRILKEGIKIK